MDGAGRDAVEALEIAGEMGELLVTQVVGDALDSFSVLEPGEGEAQAHSAKAFAEGDAVMFGEMALQCAERDTASMREQAGPEVRSESEGFPSGLLRRRIGGEGVDREIPSVVAVGGVAK